MHNENSDLSEDRQTSHQSGLDGGRGIATSRSDSQPRPRYSSDDELSALLASLPREGASLGFEDRVLRRVRAQPTPPMTFGRGLRFVAPLLVAGALGFVFGPGLLERPASQSSGEAGTQIASSEALAEGERTSGEAGSGGANSATTRPRSRAIPSVANNARVVAMPGSGMPNSNRPRLGEALDLSKIRADAARVRRQLDELRRARSAAGPTVAMTLQDGVVVEVDLRELLAALERQALAARSFETGASASAEGPRQAQPSEEPPLW